MGEPIFMPEYPDVENYRVALERVVSGRKLLRLELCSPFLLRTVEPPLQAFENRTLLAVTRIAKQLILHFDGELKLLIHLMIAGRLRWRDEGRKVPKTNLMAALEFEHGNLLFTEAGKKRRARLYALLGGDEALQPFRKGGLELEECGLEDFRSRLLLGNHTLRRALTDQSLFAGIGNAYSDEILFAARLSPLRQTQKLEPDEIERLFEACRRVLRSWTERLAQEVGEGFPETVTVFHPKMAVHGRYGEPCVVCGASVQRIRYADNETNYCPGCQNEGRLLADRSLSRLLKSDWPKSAEELEFHMASRLRTS